MARKKSDLKRSPPKSLPKRQFFIYCEGQNTEPQYFKDLAQHVDQTIVKIVPIGAAGVPKTLAEKAAGKARELRKEGKKRKANSYERLDQVWAVFDCDDHPNVSEALQICEDSGAGIGYSNPCFELWLLLHYCEYKRSEHRHKVQSDLKLHCSGYDRKHSKIAVIDDFETRLKAAEARAERLCQDREAEDTPHGNPSTTVYLLTKAIREAAAEHNAH